MQRILYICAFILLFPGIVLGNELNAGLVQGLWYSSPTVFAEVPTRMYVALRNNTDHDISGTIRFTDNDATIGTRVVSALPGRIVEGWVDWTPTFGEHKITATLTDVKLHVVGAEENSGEIESTIAEDTLRIDYDTDKDGTGNESDTDDDNDTITDEDEKNRGTNPLVGNPIPEEKVEEKATDRNTESNESGQSAAVTLATEDGLEQYLREGKTHTVFSRATDRIIKSKTSLDAYRETRQDEMDEYFGKQSTSEGNTSTGTATITRSSMDSEKSFFTQVVEAGRTLLYTAYTVILWLLSHILAHPALLELGLLILILALVYKFARKLGRRPTPKSM